MIHYINSNHSQLLQNISSVADGNSFVIKGFLQQLGFDPNELFRELSSVPRNDRNDQMTRYRGRVLTREKFYVDLIEAQDRIGLYRFPGMQYGLVERYYKRDEVPLVALLADLLTKLKIGDNEFPITFTQAIATYYVDGKDAISMHSDKKADINDTSFIMSLSFGVPRVMTLKDKVTGKEEVITLEAGDLFILSTTTNDSWQHGVLPMKGVSEPRMSIVFRDIKTIITTDELKKRVDRSEKGRKKRLENKRKREEGTLPPTLPTSSILATAVY